MAAMKFIIKALVTENSVKAVASNKWLIKYDVGTKNKYLQILLTLRFLLKEIHKTPKIIETMSAIIK